MITSLLSTSQTYFLSKYTTLAFVGERIAGVVVAYPAKRRIEIDKMAGQGMMKMMGFMTFLRKMFLFMKMSKMLGGKEKNGFKKKYHGTMKYKGLEYGEFLMEKK